MQYDNTFFLNKHKKGFFLFHSPIGSALKSSKESKFASASMVERIRVLFADWECVTVFLFSRAAALIFSLLSAFKKSDFASLYA